MSQVFFEAIDLNTYFMQTLEILFTEEGFFSVKADFIDLGDISNIEYREPSLELFR